MTALPYPDGVDVSDNRPKFLPPMLVSELMFPQTTDTSMPYLAGLGNVKGYQPITNTNPDGDYQGTSFMVSPGGQQSGSDANGGKAGT